MTTRVRIEAVPTVVARTRRLVLRQAQLADADFVLELLNEPAFLEFIGDRGVHDLDSANDYLEDGPLASYELQGYGPYVVCNASDDTAMGLCGLYQRSYLDDPDLGFAFLERFSRHGYATEAAQQVLRLAADSFALRRLFAIVNPANVRSLALLSKLGFSLDRIFVIPGENEDSQLHQIQLAADR